MPTYKFYDTVTNEEFEKFMSISSRDKYLSENPHIESRINGSPMIGDPIRLGRGDVGGFKEVLQNIHRRNPGSKMDI